MAENYSREEEGDAAGWNPDCMTKYVRGKGPLRAPHITFRWTDDDGDIAECTIPYMHASCYYTKHRDGSETIRYRGLNDEAMIKGYHLARVKKAIDNFELSALQEFSPADTAGGGGQPVISSIRVYDTT